MQDAPQGKRETDGLARALRRLVAKKVADYFLGSDADLEAFKARIFFSPEAGRDDIDAYAAELESDGLEVDVAEGGEEEGIGFVVTVSLGPPEGEEDVAAGDLPVDVELTGEVSVQQAGD